MVRRFKELVAFILTKKSILNTYDGSDKIDEAGNIHRLVFSFSFEPEKTLVAKQSVRRRKKRVKGEQKNKKFRPTKTALENWTNSKCLGTGFVSTRISDISKYFSFICGWHTVHIILFHKFLHLGAKKKGEDHSILLRDST